MDQTIVKRDVRGSVLALTEGLSFWGGVDADTGVITDVHHPQHGCALAGQIVMMPTSRGSCSGSGVLLELAISGHAPAALIFHEAENILTLGALVADYMFQKPVAVIVLSKENYDQLATASEAIFEQNQILADGFSIDLSPLDETGISLSQLDKEMHDGAHGKALQLAMNVMIKMAAVQGAKGLIDISRGHIDSCIYGNSANLVFAQTMKEMGASVRVPTTMNAISVDQENWRYQGVPSEFGEPASELASAYVAMGVQPTFTCAPYLLNEPPEQDEPIGWSESNAVIYANSVLGSRTVKHPDFFDLFVAMTGRAPCSGVYLQENRVPEICIQVDLPAAYDEAIWPLIGWVSGKLAPDRIPLIKGLESAQIGADELKALCAAFGTTSAMPLLHIHHKTPEAEDYSDLDLPIVSMGQDVMIEAWQQLNQGASDIDLVALGSPHFSLYETRQFADLMTGYKVCETVCVIVTLGRATYTAALKKGLIDKLEKAGVQIVCDLCWCSITEPVFPSRAQTLLTNSAKYAHYAPGLCGRSVRFAGLEDCVLAATTGVLAKRLPSWLC